MRHFSSMLLFINIDIAANVKFKFWYQIKNYTLTNKEHYFRLKLIVKRKWMKIVYKKKLLWWRCIKINYTDTNWRLNNDEKNYHMFSKNMWNYNSAWVFSFINLIIIVCELKQICAIIFNWWVFFHTWKQQIELKILLVCIFLIYMSMIHELIKENCKHSC